MKDSDVIELKINGTVYNHNLSKELRMIADAIDRLKKNDWDGEHHYYHEIGYNGHNLKWEIEKIS